MKSNPPPTPTAARPAKTDGKPRDRAKSRKTTVAHVRLTEAEHSTFKTLCAQLGVTPSEFLRRVIREAATGEPDLTRPEAEAIEERSRQLAKIGVNLNQLVRLANQRMLPLDQGLSLDDLRLIVEGVQLARAEWDEMRAYSLNRMMKLREIARGRT